jgi:Flp pilus assembly protein TadD
MAFVRQLQPQQRAGHGARGLAAASVCLLLGACASADGPPPLTLGETTSAPKNTTQVGQERSELAKATEWWGRKYAENTRDLVPALNYARNLKAMGEKERALAVLQQAAIFHGESRELASEYGRLALDMDQINVANRLLAMADDPIHPDWRVVSARGTVLAKQGKYGDAIPFYERALTLAHDQPSLLSNLALARAMNGEPGKAEQLLRQASASDPGSLKIRQNLALVLGLQGKYDEAKQIASVDMPADKVEANNEYLRRVVKLEPQQPEQGEHAGDPVEAVAQARPAENAESLDAAAPSDSTSWTAKVARSGERKSAKPKVAAKLATGASTKAGAPDAKVAVTLKPAIIPQADSTGSDWATRVALTDTKK